MKKILILAMSCNQAFFQEQEKNIKELYAYDILHNKYDNIDFWIYTASEDDKYHVNKKQHKLYIPCDDSLYGTYEKTYKTFNLINKLGFEYDYILRTNLSTYINVQLLNRFINENELDENVIYSDIIYHTKDSTGPLHYCLYGCGHCLIMSKKWVDVIANNHISKYKQLDHVKTEKQEYFRIDDNAIGYVINSYGLINDIDIYDIWHQINKAVSSYDFYNFIAIPFRDYITENRIHEKYLSMFIHRTVMSYDISTIDINDILKNETILLVNDWDDRTDKNKLMFRSVFDKLYKQQFKIILNEVKKSL